MVMLVAGLILQGIATAGLHEEAPGVFVDDFADGTLDGWEVQNPDSANVGVSADGQPYLQLGGETEARILVADREFEDFTIELKMRNQYGRTDMGVVFRNNCRAYTFAQGQLVMSAPGKTTREFNRIRDLSQWNTLKIVVAGGVATAYIDDVFAAQLTGIPEGPGNVGIYAKQPSYFADVKITEGATPDQYAGFEPVSDKDALVFDPGEDITLSVRISNTLGNEQSFPVSVTVMDWDNNTHAESEEIEVNVPGEGEIVQDLDIGALDEGYYKMVINPVGMIAPLAVHEMPDQENVTTPDVWPGLEGGDLQFGVYWYMQHWTLPEIWKNTYAHAAAADLRRHNFNAVVNMIGMPADQVGIITSYGLASFSRGGRHIDHPLLAGTYVGDEPHADQVDRYKEMYEDIRNTEGADDKVITTCMIGDGGLENAKKLWDELLPLGGVRLFRWYGIKREHFGVLHRYANNPTYVQVLKDARSGYQSDGYPYWIILPGLGSRGSTAYYGEATASQISSMMHLAAAYQARGMIYWTYQQPFPDSVGLVDAVSLKPFGERWAEAGKIAGLMTEHSDTLTSLKPSGATVWQDNPLVEALHYNDEDGENQYLYLVNKDPRNESNARVFQLEPGAKFYDLYNDREMTAREETMELLLGTEINTGIIELSLAPGEGVLLRYQRVVTQSDPVEYPAWVENAPEDNIRYLYDMEPTNNPNPGWVARGIMNRQGFSMREMWRWHSSHAHTRGNIDTEGSQLLYSSLTDQGVEYEKCLYAHADCRIEFDLPEGYTHFVAAAGFGNKSEQSSVVFRVHVDDELKFDSGLVRLQDGVTPVVVDIEGADRITLVTEAADFSLARDYAFWGAPRLVKRQ